MKTLTRRFIIIVLSIASLLNAQDLVISEVVSSNESGLQDAYGNYSDWIEIYNAGATLINLVGYGLGDKSDFSEAWIFPSVTIKGGDYLIIFASKDSSTSEELHASFKVSKSGETITLFSPQGSVTDKLEVPDMKTDLSYGWPQGGTSNAFFASPTPGAANSQQAYDGFLDKPDLNHPSGFYTDPISVTATHDEAGVYFRYTLDGSQPNDTSPIYPAVITFDDPSVNPNYFSMIKTNPSFDYPKTGYDSLRANTRGWLEPYTTIKKINVLKLKAYKDGYIPSKTRHATFYVSEDAGSEYAVPVISLTTDEENFFDDSMGIYVYGTTGPEGNYKMSGSDWERPTYVEYFKSDGTLEWQQELGARIHGGGGRHSTVKNLRMYAREEYGDADLDYDFHGNGEIEEYERFLIRGPGHRPDCAPRDDLADLLLQNQDMDIQHVQHAILFINGEYWGLHTIKERFDQEYLSIKYGKDEDDFVIMRNRGDLDAGELGDEDHYNDILAYVEANDMTLPAGYDHVKSQIDMDNYLTYLAAEIYMGNVDWIITNIKFWRYKGLEGSSSIVNGLDGRWRWFMFDFDLVFGGSCADVNPHVNLMDQAFNPVWGQSTTLAHGLKDNQQFSHDFVNRTCDLMNSMFTPYNFNQKLDDIDARMTPEMQEHTERWRYPSSTDSLHLRVNEVPSLNQWNYILDTLSRYPLERKRKIIDHLSLEFALGDTVHLTLDVNDEYMGKVQINSLTIDEGLDGVEGQAYPWGGTYFKEVPVTLIAQPALGFRFAKWLETGDINDTISFTLSQDTMLTAIFEIDGDIDYSAQLWINEIMADNKVTIMDDYKDYPDWVELYNPNDFQVDIAGYFVSDTMNSAYKYQLATGSSETIIEAKGFKLLWCDGRPERGTLHLPFKLDAEDELFVLHSPDSNFIDRKVFKNLEEDVSFGYLKDGGGLFKLFEYPYRPTPGASNDSLGIGGDKYNKEELFIFPNPVAQGESVYFPRDVNIRVYNGQGQLFYQEDSTRSYSTGELLQGIYYIITDENGSAKLVIR